MPLGSVQFGSGFASGIDFRAIIDAVLNAERIPIKTIQKRIDTFTKAKNSFSDFSDRLETFASSIEELNKAATVAGKTATLSDENAPFSASASSSAEPGSYDVEVSQVAQAHRVRSDALSDRYSPLVTDGTITIQAGGHEEISLDVSAANGNNSLQGIADTINAEDKGVVASIINDGTNDILVVRSEETGSTHALTITDSTNLNLDEATNELQAARSASLTIDGLAITSETNSVSGAIQGITLTLRDETTTAVTISVAADTDTTKAALESFVESYNEINTFFDEQFGTPEFRKASAVAGSSLVRNIQYSLQGLLTGAVTGIPTDKINTLAELGIVVADGTGRIELETDTFDDLVDSGRLDEIKAVLMSTGTTTDSAVIFEQANTKTQAGDYAVTVSTAGERADTGGTTAVSGSGISQDETLTVTYNGNDVDVSLATGDTISAIVSKINLALDNAGYGVTAYSSGGALRVRSDEYGAAYTTAIVSNVADPGDGSTSGIGTTQLSDTGVDIVGTIGGVAATGNGQTLIGATDSDAEGLVIQVYATASSVAGKGGDFGTVSYSQGVFDAFVTQVETLTDPFDGLLQTAQDNYDDSIEINKTRIEAIERRLDRREELLVRQFSAAEQAISQLQALQSSLGAAQSK